MICFYHSADLDGHCSGAIVKQANPDCKMIGIDYGDAFPWDNVSGTIAMKNDLWMVDYCLQPFSEMEKLGRWYGKNLIWIDHHVTAIEEAEKRGFNPPGRREVGKAACELVWEYLYGSLAPGHAIRLLGRYDVWDHSDKRTLPFQYGMRMEETWPEHQALWKNLIRKNESTYKRILRAGGLIVKYQQAQNEKIIKARGFEARFRGMKVIACNAQLTNSTLFDSHWDPEQYEAMVTFGMKPDGSWTVSLYSDREDVDVGKVCKELGGGGHKNAAGFQAQTYVELMELFGNTMTPLEG
jgi:oligoribonuclease NrnB/cAMP/cGMP phosphodiesterase (DHH superfamily)